jgi:hypothetical protein
MVYYTNSAVDYWCTDLGVEWEMKDTDTRIASRYSTRHLAAHTGCSTTAVNADRMAWTQLGVRMGFTRDENQREEILDGIRHMAWAETGARHHYPGGPAARAIARAVLGPRDRANRVGIARLEGGSRLIGLENALGTRSYVLDLDAEAVHLLDEFNHRQSPIP